MSLDRSTSSEAKTEAIEDPKSQEEKTYPSASALIKNLLEHAKTKPTSEDKESSSSSSSSKTVIQAEFCLISHRAGKIEQLNTLLLIARQQFRPDAAENNFLFNHLISLFTGININELITKDYLLYLSHITLTARADGWKTERFIPLRILSLFKTLFYVENHLHQYLPDDPKFISQLKTDDSFRNAYMSVLREEMISLNTTLLIKRAIEAIATLEDTVKPKVIDALAICITKFMLLMTECEFIFPGGWIEHATYNSFISFAGRLILRIDNLSIRDDMRFPKEHFAADKLLHETSSEDKSLLFPSFPGSLPLSEPGRIAHYIYSLIGLKLFPASSEERIQMTYYPSAPLDPIPSDYHTTVTSLRKQIIPNCTVESMKPGLYARMGNTFAAFTLQAEVHLVQATKNFPSSFLLFKKKLIETYEAPLLEQIGLLEMLSDTMFLLLTRAHYYSQKWASIFDETQFFILYKVLTKSFDLFVKESSLPPQIQLATYLLNTTTILNLKNIFIDEKLAHFLASILRHLPKLKKIIISPDGVPVPSYEILAASNPTLKISALKTQPKTSTEKTPPTTDPEILRKSKHLLVFATEKTAEEKVTKRIKVIEESSSSFQLR